MGKPAAAIGLGSKKTTSGTSGQREATTTIEDILNQYVRGTESRSATGTQATSGTQTATRIEAGGDVTQTQTRASTGRTDIQQVGDIISEGGGTLQQTMVSSAALQSVVDEILGKYRGIAPIGVASRGAGVYDATAQESMVADLLGKTLGEVARISSPVLTQELTKKVSQGPTISTTGASAETIGASTVSTPKIISDIQTQEQRAVSSEVARAATTQATTSTQKRTAEEEETTAGQGVSRERKADFGIGWNQ